MCVGGGVVGVSGDSVWDINDMMRDWDFMTELLLEEPGREESMCVSVDLRGKHEFQCQTFELKKMTL